MTVSIIGIIIGVAVLGAGIYYFVKEKNDAESKKIYSVVSVLGALLTLVMLLRLAIQA